MPRNSRSAPTGISSPTRTGRRFLCSVAILSALVSASFSSTATAGTYVVKSCGERGDNRASAFNLERLTVRMFIRRGCNAVGAGKRGLLTRNSYARGGRVRRGSEARMVMNAPPGATFVGLKWAGEVYRPDCRYEAQVYARGPAGFSTVARNFRPYERCAETKSVRISGRKGAQNYPFRTDASGRQIEATRIVQRIECVAKRSKPFCSNRRPNYVVTYRAYVTVKDETPPRGQILAETPLARGEWVNGRQPLNYEASDNVGVREAQLGGFNTSTIGHVTSLGSVPCPNGRGQMRSTLRDLLEGTQPLALAITDSASNTATIPAPNPPASTVPHPGAVGLTLDGGESWRSTNGFTPAGRTPFEPDRAPIIGAHYELCPVGGGRCLEDRQTGDGITALSNLSVPTMGEWRLRTWREDQAGNQLKDNASLPVTLRFDGERPELGFEPTDTGDPTRLAAAVSDKVSGLAGGQIEISRAGSGNWQQLTTSMEGARLVARLDDGRLEPGSYAVRAFARDQAGNQGSTDRRLDGQPMIVRIPLRAATTLQAGLVRQRHRGRAFKPRRRLRVGTRPASVVGRLTSDGGRPVSGAQLAVFRRVEGQPEAPVGTARTGPRGRFRYPVSRGPSRTLRFAYAGTPVTLPTERQVTVLVPASTSFSVSRRRLLNGGAVRFRGRLRAPKVGKLVEMQVQLSGRWQTFRTTRTGRRARWRVAYRFRRTCGLARYRFRARLPREQGYPYAAGRTHALKVSVRGRRCR